MFALYTDQNNAHQSQPSTDPVDTPYTSSLLRYDTQLKETSALVATLRAVISYVTTSERASLQSLIQSTKSLNTDVAKELEDLLECAEMLVQYEYEKPGRIFETIMTCEEVGQGLVTLGRMISKLILKADELEAVRARLLQLWGTEAFMASNKIIGEAAKRCVGKGEELEAAEGRDPDCL
ncbi:uncharacterized protein M421DRAFT_303721 [Didymella exigua CBS 183.55]|uniref:Uncharacterized protein n=1 Tax=Didymella exigua CBS 183.55 TaxID=1150837 RepID=A0A6A5RA18_9PLEO|nr:uncharacterized protein M421DRAFT_303721 [Didymella exigua CBS 183.55]KAF1923874.1 hypothetical protein M421DRAFT_303721 [Didymella exigua CBS 183.55]